MANIVFAWELGSGFGHLSKLGPIAKLLFDQGHNIYFIVRDLDSAVRWFGSSNYIFLQAPISRNSVEIHRPPANYAEILLAEGYGDLVVATGVIGAWINTFRLCRADIIIADHSPMAVLAAQIIGIKRILVGSGFELPPICSAMPCIRPWDNIPSADLDSSERKLLMTLNTVALSYCADPIRDFADLFSSQWTAFTSFPELDHYGVRHDVNYVGPIIEHGRGISVSWHKSPQIKIFVYLHNGTRESKLVIEALTQLSYEAIAVVPGLSTSKASSLSTSNIRVFGELVDIGPLLGQMDLAIFHGGVGAVNSTLLGGVPMILIPRNIEQYMHARRVEAFGAGIVIGASRRIEDINMAISRVLTLASFSECANSFKEKYREYNPACTVRNIASMINRNLN